MQILYLDQNKWIELARAVKSPDDFPAQYAVLEALVKEANADRLLVPLTRSARLQPGEVQWLAPGPGTDENTGTAPYEAIIVEFKK